MPQVSSWRVPPQDVTRAVEAVYGEGFYQQLSQAWDRVAAVDPSMLRSSWYRPPDLLVAMKYGDPRRGIARNPRAALLSQHGLGLAVDVTASNEAARARLIEAARAAGFHVGTYTSSRQLHVSALTPDQWARSPLLPFLRARLRPYLAARGVLERAR